MPGRNRPFPQRPVRRARRPRQFTPRELHPSDSLRPGAARATPDGSERQRREGLRRVSSNRVSMANVVTEMEIIGMNTALLRSPRRRQSLWGWGFPPKPGPRVAEPVGPWLPSSPRVSGGMEGGGPGRT